MKIKALENFTYYDDSPIQVYKGNVIDMDPDDANFLISEGRAEEVASGGSDDTPSDGGSSTETGPFIVTFPYLDGNIPRTADCTFGDILEAAENGRAIWIMAYGPYSLAYYPAGITHFSFEGEEIFVLTPFRMEAREAQHTSISILPGYSSDDVPTENLDDDELM